MKVQKSVFSTLVVILFFFGCEDKEKNEMYGPEIEWISGGTTATYLYTSGHHIGYEFQRSFIVLNGSGEVSINVQILNVDSTKVSGTFEVEEGLQYAIKVPGYKTGTVSSSGGKCMDVVFSSPNCLTTYEIGVWSYTVFGEWVDLDYCPKSLRFEEIVLSE